MDVVVTKFNGFSPTFIDALLLKIRKTNKCVNGMGETALNSVCNSNQKNNKTNFVRIHRNTHTNLVHGLWLPFLLSSQQPPQKKK